MQWIDNRDYSISGDYRVQFKQRMQNYTVTFKGKEIGCECSLNQAKMMAEDHDGTNDRRFLLNLIIFFITYTAVMLLIAG